MQMPMPWQLLPELELRHVREHLLPWSMSGGCPRYRCLAYGYDVYTSAPTVNSRLSLARCLTILWRVNATNICICCACIDSGLLQCMSLSLFLVPSVLNAFLLELHCLPISFDSGLRPSRGLNISTGTPIRAWFTAIFDTLQIESTLQRPAPHESIVLPNEYPSTLNGVGFVPSEYIRTNWVIMGFRLR